MDSGPVTWARVVTEQPQGPSGPHIWPTEDSEAGALGKRLLNGGNDRKDKV